MKKERLYWIDRVKFLACVFIMLAHFQDAVLDACTLPPAASPLYTALNNFLAPLETGKCWVIVFCILSGFLSCREVRSFRELAAEGLTRWLRFFLPLLAVNALAFVLLRTGRMYHGVYGERFGNSWLLGHYTGHTGARDVLIQSAILGSAFNGPLWMLRPLFLGNLAVLTVSFLGSRLPEKFRSPLEWAAFGLLLLGGTRSVSLFYMAVTFSGLLIARTRRAVLSRKWIPAGILVPWLSLYLPQLGESFAFVHSAFCYFLLGADSGRSVFLQRIRGPSHRTFSPRRGVLLGVRAPFPGRAVPGAGDRPAGPGSFLPCLRPRRPHRFRRNCRHRISSDPDL